MSSSAGSQQLDATFAKHRARLLAFIRNSARGVLRYESEDDLLQSTWLRCVRQSERQPLPEHESDLIAWLITAARREIADRHDYWSALKRSSGRVLRLTASDPTWSSQPGVRVPVDTPGPATWASRRELVVLATRALAILPARDRTLVEMAAEGLGLEEQADRLGLTYAAVQRAGHRAAERFRKAFELVRRHA